MSSTVGSVLIVDVAFSYSILVLILVMRTIIVCGHVEEEDVSLEYRVQ